MCKQLYGYVVPASNENLFPSIMVVLMNNVIFIPLWLNHVQDKDNVPLDHD